MTDEHWLFQTDGSTLLAVGLLAGLPTLLAVLAGYDDLSVVLRSPSIFVLFLVFGVGGSLLVTGLLAVLSVGYRLVSPAVVVGLVLLLTMLGSEGDIPDISFTVAGAPSYLTIALILGSLEHKLRFGSFLPARSVPPQTRLRVRRRARPTRWRCTRCPG